MKAIVDSMIDAVNRGEVVETPFGTVKRTLIRRKRRLMRNRLTGKLMLVNRRAHWRMLFRPFPEYE
jgi:nucleoid DNA-binding protein